MTKQTTIVVIGSLRVKIVVFVIFITKTKIHVKAQQSCRTVDTGHFVDFDKMKLTKNSCPCIFWGLQNLSMET